MQPKTPLRRFFWIGEPIPYLPGQTVAAALNEAGIFEFGQSQTGMRAAVFCGIGQCQNCMVQLENGAETESCLLLCSDGLRVQKRGFDTSRLEQEHV